MMFVLSSCKQQPGRSYHYSFHSRVWIYISHSCLFVGIDCLYLGYCLFFVRILLQIKDLCVVCCSCLLSYVCLVLSFCWKTFICRSKKMLLAVSIRKQWPRRACHSSFRRSVWTFILHSYLFFVFGCLYLCVCFCLCAITNEMCCVVCCLFLCRFFVFL